MEDKCFFTLRQILSVMLLSVLAGVIIGYSVAQLENMVVSTPTVPESVEPQKTTGHKMAGQAVELTEEMAAESLEMSAVAVSLSYVYFDVPLDEDLQRYIFEVCDEYEIDPTIIIAMIFKESTYRDWLIGDSGNSFGLMQIQERWHRERMRDLGVTDLLDPYQNVTVGIDYFTELYNYHQGLEWTLMAYNGGVSYANRMAGQGRVSDYALSVLNKSDELGWRVW